MILNIKHFVIFITIVGLTSCDDRPQALSEVQGKQLPISDSLRPSDSIEAFVAPYRKRVNEVLDSTLAYAAFTISKEEGDLNTPAGNLMADILLEQVSPIFESRSGKAVDFVVLNHGGIRSIISQGDVSARTAYEVMPFENSISVVELNGQLVRRLIAHLIQADRPHPISGMQIVIDRNDRLQSVNIQGKPFDENRNYFVATSSYLVSGGDDMGFFKDGLSFEDTNYLIRNAMIDYFKKTDTLRPIIDDRFIKLN
ncbi:MAG: 5'-nucleotidase [Bacteroidota bacterium]